MNKIIWAMFLFSLSVSSFAKVDLICDGKIPDSDDGVAQGFIFGGNLELLCHDEEANEFQIQFRGVGPTIEFVESAKVTVSCPNVNKQVILEGRTIRVYGPRLSGEFVNGGEVMTGVNLRGNRCSISGLQSGYGAAVQIGQLRISKKLDL